MLKKYDMNSKGIPFYDKEGMWIPADIGQEMYDALQDCESVLMLSCHETDWKLAKKITGLLAKAEGAE